MTSEKVESFLAVMNDGKAAIWYNWMRLPDQIPSRETKGGRMPCFYFDTRPGMREVSKTFVPQAESRNLGVPWDVESD